MAPIFPIKSQYFMPRQNDLTNDILGQLGVEKLFALFQNIQVSNISGRVFLFLFISFFHKIFMKQS